MQSPLLAARSVLETRGTVAQNAMPEAIADSWHRCLRSGLNPLGKPIEAVVSRQELLARKQQAARVLALTRPELEMLSSQIAGSNYLVAFADPDGVVLDTIFDDEFRQSSAGRTILQGSVWTEDVRGTNALGLALHSGKPSMVTGPEHFFSGHGGVSCQSAPIYDSQERLVGLIDASSEVAARQQHTGALVNLAAINISNRLFVEDHRDQIIVLFHPRPEYLTTQSVGMLAFDAQGQLSGGNQRAKAMLHGISLCDQTTFNSIFQENFGTALQQFLDGHIIRLTDWMNSGVFAQIRLTRPTPDSQSAIARRTTLWLPALRATPAAAASTRQPRVFEDDVLRHHIRMSLKAAAAGMPVFFWGETGSGKTETALCIHAEQHSEKPFIVVDCGTLQAGSVVGHQNGDAAETRSGDWGEALDLAVGGTLYLDEIGAASREAAATVNSLLSKVQEIGQAGEGTRQWTILCSSQNDLGALVKSRALPERLAQRLTGYCFRMPRVADRTDLRKLARNILAEVAPDAMLAESALRRLQSTEFPAGFYDLKKLLLQIGTQTQNKVIRDIDVDRALAITKSNPKPCEKCAGHQIREAKCLEIQRVLVECDGKVSLAARRLGVSRNTIYAHMAW